MLNVIKTDAEYAGDKLQKVTAVWVFVILFLAVSNFGLGFFHLTPRYQNLGVTMFMLRMLAPALAMLLILRCPGAWFRGVGLLLLGPLASILLLLLVVWLITMGGKVYQSTDATELINGSYSYAEARRGNRIYAIDCNMDARGFPYTITQVKMAGPYFVKYVSSIELPERISLQFIPSTEGPVEVKVMRYKNMKVNFLMNANVDDLLSGKVKLGPEK